MKILICGGAGYIGSHTRLVASQAGHDVHVIDNLSTGHREAVPADMLSVIDIGNYELIHDHLSKNTYNVVMHFCASSLVGESVTNPAKYYENNVANTLTLLRAMHDTGHDKLVFSSTAAVYGNPEKALIDEDHPKNPINPYGRSKWMIEQILQDYFQAYGLRSVSLRYFNAAGAEPEGRIGELHNPETHLIPNILKSVASGGELKLKVFGNDYPTRDGTCERDYIHVCDLAQAHLMAGEYLSTAPGAHNFNLGNGSGYTILEIIAAAEGATEKKIDYDMCERRPGDPPSLIADTSKAANVLKWSPEIKEVKNLIVSSWKWHKHETFSSF